MGFKDAVNDVEDLESRVYSGIVSKRIAGPFSFSIYSWDKAGWGYIH